MKKIVLLFSVLFVFCLTSSFAQTSLKLVTYAGGYSNPVDVTNAGDNRLFVVTQPGLIYILDSAGNKLATPFLDIDDRVVDTGNERGLLGIAFHPDYANNGYFYVNYVGNDGDTRISRFTVTANPNIADPTSELIMMTIDQPYQNHKGGCVKFGPDGYLYVGLGDGGSGGDPQGNSQNPKTFLGKMLRLDVDGGTPYGIPADNPFFGQTDTLPEIWALGLRNPWRYSFDRLTGDLWIGDVGQGDWEEIDLEPAGTKGGLNYGWRCYEGFVAYNTKNCGPENSYVFPVHAYDHSGGNCSLTGGFVYRGSVYPGLYGKYIYADYCSGKVYVLYKNNQGNYTNVLFADLGNYDFSGFGEDLSGELYITGLKSGNIFKITLDCPASSTQYNVVRPCPDTAAGGIQLSGSGNLSYLWSTGDTTQNIKQLTPGYYAVTIINNDNFCAEVIDSIEVAAWPALDATLIWSDSVLTLDVPGTNVENIQWFLNGSLIAGADSSSIKPVKSGVYSAAFTASESGCNYESDSLQIIITSSVGLKPGMVEYLWPNPAQNTLNIKFTESAESFSFRIYSSTGMKLMSGENTQSPVINISELSTGLYFAEIITTRGRQILNFMKK